MYEIEEPLGEGGVGEVYRAASTAPAPGITFLLNFADELARKVPAR